MKVRKGLRALVGELEDKYLIKAPEQRRQAVDAHYSRIGQYRTLTGVCMAINGGAIGMGLTDPGLLPCAGLLLAAGGAGLVYNEFSQTPRYESLQVRLQQLKKESYRM